MTVKRFWLLLLGCLALSAPANAQKLFEESDDALTKEIERMYVRGLQFLAQGQLTSGGFKDSPYGTSPGVVGFAVIALLAHGVAQSLRLHSELLDLEPATRAC